MYDLHVSRTRTVCSLIRAVARARVSADARVCARVRVCMCVPLGLSVCACVHSVCERALCTAPRRCARPPIARRRRAVFIARPAPGFAAARAWLRSAPPAGLARVGRRCHVDEPHGQRGMGCALLPNVRGRRRRRHLHPRRQRRPQRRLGEHRRRCAGRTEFGGGRWGTRGDA